MAGALVCLVAASALAQTVATTRTVVVTLLLSDAKTTDGAVQKEKYLAVAAAGGVGFKEAASWLYFNASALPSDIQLVDVQLQLVPKEGAARGMAITVVPAKEKAPGEHAEPLSYTPPAAQERNTLVSPPLPTDPRLLALRSDTVSLTPGNLLLESGQGRPRYIGLLLLPQPNASRRIYFGLNSKEDAAEAENHPGRLPRLIITYRRQIPPIPPCATAPSELATIQSDGRADDTSSCNFIPRTDIPVSSSDYKLYPYEVATGTRTKTQAAYRDRLYVVQQAGAAARLEELGPLGGLIASVPLDGEVRAGSPMVVDSFGRLRIVTNTAIFTAQLGNSSNGTDLPARIDKKLFDFGQVPKIVVPGPDGTLYIVKRGIFALNPEVGELDKNGRVVRPEKLWEVANSDDTSPRITLSPDGHFLYALARFSGKNKSRFVAINAQTGKDVQLLPGKVGTSGKAITWISGMNFDRTAVGQTIPIGSLSCTVVTVSSTSLTCKEDLGANTGVAWADFPEDLKSFHNPVVAQGLNGVDFIYVTGDSGSRATLWAVQNNPVTENGDLLARFTGVWKYPLEGNTVAGQPILDPTVRSENKGLTKKRVYFFQGSRTEMDGPSKLIAITALDGTRVFEPAAIEPAGKWIPEANPVVDAAGNIMIWADNNLYGFSAETKPLFTAKIVSSPPQLLFGPGGTLYAAYESADSKLSVSALIPSFQQSNGSPTNIYSPTNLYLTGSPAGQGVKSWILGARGSVLLGENFTVKTGETLSVRVNADQ